MTKNIGSFVWFELTTDDVNASKTFYGETVGWKSSTMDMGDFEYTMLSIGEDNAQCGVLEPQAKGTPNHWISYVSVEDVDTLAEKVTKAGGKVVVPPRDIPNVGRFALVADPQGAMFNLFCGANDDKKLEGFHWNELWAKDAEAVIPFYKEVLGYEVDSMDMPTGKYFVFKKDGEGVGGCMSSPSKDIPAMWLPYIHVDNADEAVARAKKNGGTLQGEVMEVPDVGRFGVVLDNKGAAIGLIAPKAS